MHAVALRMLTGDRAKYLGLVIGIAFATLLMSQQVSIFIGLMSRTASQILDVGEAQVWVMDPRVQYVDEIEPLTDTALDRVRGVPGVAWAEPFYKGLTVARATDGVLQQVILMGVADASLAGAPRAMVMGDPRDLRQPDAMIIDRAGFMFIWPGEPLQLGKVLELNDRRAVIVGIAESSPPFTTFPVVYTRYSDAMGFIGQQRKQMSFVIARAEDGTDPAALARRITEQTGLKAMTRLDFAWATVDYYIARTGIPVNFGITVALGFLVGAAIAGQTFFLFVVENQKQFAALKAMGVSGMRIVGMVLLQGLVVALVGYGLGIGACALFFETTGRASINLRGFMLHPEVMAGTAVAVLVIVMLASLASIRRVLTVDPATVFRG
ncbi:MAG: ABC transporter permease [Geminicoccaceae bacterium]